MSIDLGETAKPPKTAFFEAFTPKLISVFREGYTLAFFKADALAGLTVAIVALPLSMAIAIGSGAKPENGLFAAIIGGFVISALGGSRYQIGGPAGAFIVVVAAAIERYSFDGFLLAALLSGLLLVVAGFARLGSYIKYIPHPVVTGFTAGIAVIIFASQLRDLFGLSLAKEPAAFVPKLEALWAAHSSINPVATTLAASCILLIVGLRAWRPKFPGLLAIVVLSGLATWEFGLPVETIGTRFGGIPSGLPWPTLPAINWDRIVEVSPAAFTFALLGSIESLLSAVVADGMTGRRHRPNAELVAQGIGNVASALFGGLCVTGTIARTATNVRAFAHGPVAGMLHALFLLAFMVIAAPLARYIPLAALAAVLTVVCWNMADKAEFAAILRHDRAEAVVLLATFLLTLFRDLTEGITVGVILGSMLFMHRMAQVAEVRAHAGEDDVPGAALPAELAGVKDVLRLRIAGPFFFGSAGIVGSALDRIGGTPQAFVIDLGDVPFADATAAQTLELFVKRAKKNKAGVFLAAVNPKVREVLEQNGMGAGEVTYLGDAAGPR